MVSHFGNGLGGIYQHPGSVAQPDLGKTVDKRIARALFEKAAKGGVGHIGQPGYFVQGYGFVEVMVHVFQRFFNPAAVIGKLLGIVKRRIGQNAHIPRNG